jgi:hypothetical protein
LTAAEKCLAYAECVEQFASEFARDVVATYDGDGYWLRDAHKGLRRAAEDLLHAAVELGEERQRGANA